MFRFLLWILLSTSLSLAQAILVDDIEKFDDFILEYYQDKEQKMTIETIQKIDFNQQTDNQFTFGYIGGDTWFKLHINNQSQNSRFVLHLNEPFFNEVNFFEPYQDHWKKQSGGLALFLETGDKREINPSFEFSIEPNSQKTFYIQTHAIANVKGTSYGEFSIFTKNTFVFQNIFTDYLLYIFYFGTVFFVLIFNIFIFIILKDKIYLYYVGFIFFKSLYILAFSGLAFYLGLANWIHQLNTSLLIYFIFFILFSSKFLNMAFYLPLMNTFFKIFISILILSLPLVFISYKPWFDIMIKTTTFLVPFFIYTSIYIFIKGKNEAKYYIVALIIYIASMVSLSFVTQGIIANSDINHYAFIYGSYLEIIIFSFVLSYRFYSIQNEIISIKQNNEQLLEKEIKERTHKINILLKEKDLLIKEVHHRVKNNFQILISLISLKASQDINVQYQYILEELINRIKSMSLVHHYILDADTFIEINSQDYILKIIEEIEKVYNKKDIDIHKNIDITIFSIDEALAISVIVNEVLTNAIKHHSQQYKVIIDISFKVQFGKKTLTIQDNGEGFTLNNKYKGFGLKMIKQFSKKLNSGQIKFSFANGTKFLLSFSNSRIRKLSQMDSLY